MHSMKVFIFDNQASEGLEYSAQVIKTTFKVFFCSFEHESEYIERELKFWVERFLLDVL